MKGFFWRLIRIVRRSTRDERGSATVEFVIALPVILAMLAFAVQYGNVMKVRIALDGTARDAARYLARAPIAEDTGRVPDEFVLRMQRLIEEKIGNAAARSEAGGVPILRPWCPLGSSPWSGGGDCNLLYSGEFDSSQSALPEEDRRYAAYVDLAVRAPMPLLRFLNLLNIFSPSSTPIVAAESVLVASREAVHRTDRGTIRFDYGETYVGN